MHDYLLKELIEPLGDWHRKELLWFHEQKGRRIGWKDIPNRSFAKVPKGIYCPKGKEYCLAVKNIIGSEYSDKESLLFEHNDGSFYFEYPPESNHQGMEYHTNKSILNCSNKLIPIGLIYQLSKKPDPTKYLVCGLSLVRYQKDTNVFQFYGFSYLEKVRFVQ